MELLKISIEVFVLIVMLIVFFCFIESGRARNLCLKNIYETTVSTKITIYFISRTKKYRSFQRQASTTMAMSEVSSVKLENCSVLSMY